MRFIDFMIGTEFYTSDGKWVCIDKGDYHIIAVPADDYDEYLTGDDWMVSKIVFDLNDFTNCSVDNKWS